MENQENKNDEIRSNVKVIPRQKKSPLKPLVQKVNKMIAKDK